MDKHVTEGRPGRIMLVGIPFDGHSSFMKGSSQGPGFIRKALYSSATNLCTETGLDLAGNNRLQDLGDMEMDSGIESYHKITDAVSQIIQYNHKPIILGGDHSLTYPVLRAFGNKYDRLNLLHLDAHPDFYHEFENNRHSHACPMARIMEKNLVARLIQYGIRAGTPHQRRQSERFKAEVYEMAAHGTPAEFKPEGVEGPLYLSIDLDVLDPAFAPGVSHPEPGGLSTRELLGIIQNIKSPIVGADIVELNPTRDLGGITAMAAAKLLKEISAGMIRFQDESTRVNR